MLEMLKYAFSKEGLTALDGFIAGKSGFYDLAPFALPVRYQVVKDRDYLKFSYYQGVATGTKEFFRFYLPREKLTTIGDSIYVIPHSEISSGRNPYYWLNLHATPEADLPVLTSCRLRPEEGKHKIDFKTWHGLEEQLLADYVLGINELKFEDLLPFSLAFLNKDRLLGYWIAGVEGLSIRIGRNGKIQDSDTLRFIFKTDDQKLYEWVDILKADETLLEEKWSRVSSYRISSIEHRIYSNGWVGSERQLLIDRMRGRSDIEFKNLRPIRAIAVNSGRTVNVVNVYSYSAGRRVQRLRGEFSLNSKPLATGMETISMPKQDDQVTYEWLELYRFDPQTNGPTGEAIASARITPEGLNQKNWSGVENQLLKDYTYGSVSFDNLKPVTVKKGKDEGSLYLWSEGKNGKDNLVCLSISRRFNLKVGDCLVLVPEKETEEGTDFLLVRDNITLARYRLDLKTKKFSCIDNLVAAEQDNLLEDYEKTLLSGQIISYEEFMNMRGRKK